MSWRRVCLLVLSLALAAETARAGIFFNRKPKTQPTERIPTLLYTLKSDASEKKRAEAAEELRNFDAGANPEIVPALIESAQKDPQASVRIEAVQTLSKLRPISQLAGRAIEQAASSDPSMRVQLQARSALLQYRMSGYHNGKGDTLPLTPGRPIRTDEPPLAPPLDPPPVHKSQSPPTGTIVPSSAPRPMPASAPVRPALVPATPPPLAAPPVEEGPELAPPK